MADPIKLTIAPHPYLAGWWTHLVEAGHARRRGWLTTCDVPLGAWRTRQAAKRAAQRLTLRGVAA